MNRLAKDNYKRPTMTKTDRLTSDEIKNLLEDYTRFTSFDNVPLGTHIRYFVVKDGTQLFRLGGFLLNKGGLPAYIVLSSGGKENVKTWTVQVKDTVFFKKMTFEDLKKEHDTVIVAMEQRISQLEKLVVDLGGKL